MAETFLRRWFGGKPTAPAADEARAEIDRAFADRPDLRGPLAWLRAVADELVPDHHYVYVTLPAQDEAREAAHAGRPLLRNTSFAVDPDGFARRWRRVCDALAVSQSGAIPSELATTAKRRELDPNELASAVVNGLDDVLRERAGRLGIDASLLDTLLRFTLFAGFAALNVEAEPLRQGVPWDRGYCPTCGSMPLLAEFRGLDQSRFLRCGLCAASWEAARQWCPACGNRDHETLGFLAKEGEEARYRVATCDACRAGVKTLSTLSALPPVMLLVADAATLHLDLVAAERGYVCPPVVGPE